MHLFPSTVGRTSRSACVSVKRERTHSHAHKRARYRRMSSSSSRLRYCCVSLSLKHICFLSCVYFFFLSSHFRYVCTGTCRIRHSECDRDTMRFGSGQGNDTLTTKYSVRRHSFVRFQSETSLKPIRMCFCCTANAVNKWKKCKWEIVQNSFAIEIEIWNAFAFRKWMRIKIEKLIKKIYINIWPTKDHIDCVWLLWTGEWNVLLQSDVLCAI